MAEVQNLNRVDTGMGQKDAQSGFPSHMIDPKVKKQPEWCMQFVRGMHESNSQMTIFRNNTKNYKQWRDYANGKQGIDQYKEMLAPSNKRNRGKKNQTWRNLDYSVLPIAPKFVRVLEGMIMKQPRVTRTKGIDNESLDAERLYESKMSEYIFNRQWLDQVKEAAPSVTVESPVQEGDPEPMTFGEIPLYKDLYYKDQNALELKDVIDTTFTVNKMDTQGRRDYVNDMIQVGVAGTRTMIDSNGFLKTRRVIPERVITNNCKQDDFSDISWGGEYMEMTIADLKQLAGDQFTEKQYKKIAESSSNKKTFTPNFTPSHLEEDMVSFPYDQEKITVLDAEWFSVDNRTTKVSRNKYGNKRAERVGNDFLPKGVSDDQYKEKHKGERYLVRRNVKNVYRAMWVVNTNFVFNYGLATDMIRQGSALEDCKLSYAFQTVNHDSIIRQIIPILDQIQINWLQFQNHIARSRPSGLSIEMSALENLTLGKGGQKMTPKEALRLYFDTGILVWRRKDWAGHNSQWKPVEELNNGIGDAAAQHFQNIIGMIDMLRNIIGINEVADASTPNPEIGKFVTETAMVATKDAINYLYYSDQNLYQATAERVTLLLPDLIKRGKSKAFIGALGLRTYNFYRNNIDLTRYEFSTKVEAGYSDEQRAIVQKYLEVDLSNGAIGSDAAIMIENEENPHKQAAMLRHAKLEKQRMDMQNQEAVAKQETEKNIASTQASAAAEIEKEKALSQLRIAEDNQKTLNQIKIDNNKIKGEILLKNLDIEGKTSLNDEDNDTKIEVEDKKSKTTLQVAKISAQAAKQAAKNRPAPSKA